MTKPIQLLAVRSMVNIGRARESLEAALHHLHAAMGVTPLGWDSVSEMGQTAQRLTIHLREHREAIGQMYDGARRIDDERGDKGD